MNPPAEPQTMEPTKCSRCMANHAQSPHTCPYASEINDDDKTLCDCCPACIQECCDDI